jgi:hypothetical protein
VPLRVLLYDHVPSAHTAVAPAALAAAYGSWTAGGWATGAAAGCETGAALLGVGEVAITTVAADAAGDAENRPEFGLFEEDASAQAPSSKRAGPKDKSVRFVTLRTG